MQEQTPTPAGSAQSTLQSARADFTMDPNLLVSVIKAQAGTLTKALLEGVMNSIDAGATRVDVELRPEGFTLRDDGRGFQSEEEVTQWFGRFGTPHQEGDAIYGRFRMGRGQLMSYARTSWRSGRFVLEVDIEREGLSYRVSKVQAAVKGCTIEGTLYEPLKEWQLAHTLGELKKAVAYTPRPVYVNGKLYGDAPARLKTWTYEDEDAYYRVMPGARDIALYNQGVFVEDVSSWRTGAGGIVVSKKPLVVNFARNSVLETRCAVWKRIQGVLKGLTLSKLSTAKALTEGERTFLARRVGAALEDGGHFFPLKAKLLTDPTGKHWALEDLRKFSRFAHSSEANELACAVQGAGLGVFVVTDELLSRFGRDSLESWLEQMRLMPGLVAKTAQIIALDKLSALGLGRASEVSETVLSPRQAAAYEALCWLNERVAQALVAQGYAERCRQLRLGQHQRGTFVAWTDGQTYITANRRYLKFFARGLDGVHEWALTLVHEYMHDSDDSESHQHADVFYRKFHDAAFGISGASGAGLGNLSREGLQRYLDALRARGVARPHGLTRQLRAPAKSGRASRPSTPGTREDADEVED